MVTNRRSTMSLAQALPRRQPLFARALRTAALALLPLLALAPAAQAAMVFAPFSGSGNAVVFDPGTGEGGWVGSIAQFPDPDVADPLDLVSVVLFTVDPLTQLLSGQFSFTRSTDLGATLFGLVAGSTTDADVFGSGGQFALDYSIQGGTGDFAGASGFGLSFLQFDPNGFPDNYAESGLLAFNVPEPGSLPLLAGALLVMARLRRRRRLH
jgi:opacity protein-like surface antigen